MYIKSDKILVGGLQTKMSKDSDYSKNKQKH